MFVLLCFCFCLFVCLFCFVFVFVCLFVCLFVLFCLYFTSFSIENVDLMLGLKKQNNENIVKENNTLFIAIAKREYLYFVEGMQYVSSFYIQILNFC